MMMNGLRRREEKQVKGKDARTFKSKDGTISSFYYAAGVFHHPSMEYRSGVTALAHSFQ